jgi:hypothetical protein
MYSLCTVSVRPLKPAAITAWPDNTVHARRMPHMCGVLLHALTKPSSSAGVLAERQRLPGQQPQHVRCSITA